MEKKSTNPRDIKAILIIGAEIFYFYCHSVNKNKIQSFLSLRNRKKFVGVANPTQKQNRFSNGQLWKDISVNCNPTIKEIEFRVTRIVITPLKTDY
jgi:hypothetical protein